MGMLTQICPILDKKCQQNVHVFQVFLATLTYPATLDGLRSCALPGRTFWYPICLPILYYIGRLLNEANLEARGNLRVTPKHRTYPYSAYPNTQIIEIIRAWVRRPRKFAKYCS